MNAATYSNDDSRAAIFPLISSLLVVMFLFFIDEGYYDLRWMKDPGNWVAFLIYLVPAFTFQWVARVFVFRKGDSLTRNLLSFFVGLPVGVALVWWTLS